MDSNVKQNDWIAEIAPEIPVESLPEDMQYFAEVVGVEVVLRVSESMGGSRIYIPKIGNLVRIRRDMKIRDEFNGTNYRALAKKYDVTETWIREIIKQKQ